MKSTATITSNGASAPTDPADEWLTPAEIAKE
jgi:hypothetical protein